MLTKKEFEDAYWKFPPKKCEMFFLKYISMHSFRDNKWLAIFISLVLVFPFILETICYLLNLGPIIQLIPTGIYIILLGIFGGFWLKIWFLKKYRYGKIRKYLAISKKEYKELIIAYYYHKYSSVKDFIAHNSKIK